MKKINNILNDIFKIRRNNKEGLKKFTSSLWAIFFGLIIGSLFLLMLNKNPFGVFYSMFTGAWASKKILLLYFGMFAFGAMSIAMAFKGGMFNIGVPGQMMLSGGLSIYILLSISKISTAWIFLILLFSILIGSLLAFIVGALKTFFNVNEVVTTIMLNWIIFYFLKFIFRTGTQHNSQGLSKSKTIDLSNTLFASGNSTFIIVFIILTVLTASFILFFIFYKTTIGFKIKSIGMNVHAGKYAGYNAKLIQILTMTAAGGLAGMSGFIFYIMKNGSIDMSSGQPLFYGFDAIVIALIAQSNFIGILGSAMLYSVFQTGINWVEMDHQLGSEFYQILVGIIVYLSAISIIFNHFNLAERIIHFFKLVKNKDFVKRRQEIIQDHKKQYLETKEYECKKFMEIHKNIKTSLKGKEKKHKYREVIRINKAIKILANTLQKEHKSNMKVLNHKITVEQNSKKIMQLYDKIKMANNKLQQKLINIGFYDYVNIKLELKNIIVSKKEQIKVLKIKHLLQGGA